MDCHKEEADAPERFVRSPESRFSFLIVGVDLERVIGAQSEQGSIKWPLLDSRKSIITEPGDKLIR